MKYNLYKDSLMKVWVRDHYEIEAESLKEAIDQINDGSADYVDSEVLWDDFQDTVDISENEYIVTGKKVIGYSGDKWNPMPIYEDCCMEFKCWNYYEGIF